MVSKGKVLSHSGVINRFGDLYVRTDRVPRHLGRNLRRALTVRGKARYDFQVEIGADEATMVLQLAQELAEQLNRFRREIEEAVEAYG